MFGHRSLQCAEPKTINSGLKARQVKDGFVVSRV